MTAWRSPADCRQSGLALPVALILMIVITLLGLAIVRGSIINESLASNMQQKFITSEAAKSGVESVWDAAYLRGQIATAGNGALDDPPPVLQPTTRTGMDMVYDIDTTKGSVDIEGEVSVQYCGESEPIGGGLDANEAGPTLVSVLVDVTSNAGIERSKARSLAVQRAALTSVKSGRTGACVTH